MDSTKYPLYALAKQRATLENEYKKKQQSLRMKSKLELLNMIKKGCKLIDDITTVTFPDNILEKQETGEPYLEMQSENVPHLQNLKQQIFQIFAVQDTLDDVEFPEDLENRLHETKMEIRKHKEQIREYLKLMNNCDAIFKENSLERSMEDENCN